MSRRTRLTCALSALLVAVLALVVWQVPQVASAQNESGGGSPQDVVWSFDPTQSQNLPTLENAAGTWSGISIDATSGKFSPRSSDGDTQINAGTKLSFEVSESVAGATIEIIPSGGTVSVSATVDDEDVSVNTTPGDNVALSVGEQGGTVVLTFENYAYLKAMTLTYGEAPEEFPGTPAGVEAKDAVWSFVGSDEPEIQGTTAVWGTLKIDATSGKFDLRGTDAQVNAGTSIYVPVAQSDDGASLIVAGSANNQQVYVDDAAIELGRPVSVDTTSGPRYVKLSVGGDGSAYLTSISIDYAADTSTYPGTPEGVSAADMTWDLTQGGEQVQGARGEFHGILVDATAG